ncbi:MAG: CaiB/BaiF CoA transferase family protein [Enterobacteriaceae bacterium]
MSTILSGIRVLDLTRILAGPWATQTFADLGAEVIKAERPVKGDDTRSFAPPFLHDKNGDDTSEGAYYLSINRGKKSITVNIASKEGQDIIRALACKSDVFIENYKVGDMARYGLSYDDLKKINPRLIYCSITGFGQNGPMAHLPGYDFIAQGMGGLMSITGERDDKPGGGPQKVGVAVTDIMTGLYANIAILAALIHRNQTGIGQYIDLSLLDVLVAMTANMEMNYLCTGVVPIRTGNAHPNVMPYQVFNANDGEFIVTAANDGQFKRLCDVLGCPELAVRYPTNMIRVSNYATIAAELQKIFDTASVEEWIARIQPYDIPCGPINNMEQVFNNPQVIYRNMLRHIPHPLSGTVPTVANPINYSETPIEYLTAPPLLGQHTDEILTGLLEMSQEEVSALRNKKVI